MVVLSADVATSKGIVTRSSDNAFGPMPGNMPPAMVEIEALIPDTYFKFSAFRISMVHVCIDISG